MLVIDDNPILCQEEAVCVKGAVKQRGIVLIVRGVQGPDCQGGLTFHLLYDPLGKEWLAGIEIPKLQPLSGCKIPRIGGTGD